MSDYLDLNRANWDERADVHAASADYRVAALLESGFEVTGLQEHESVPWEALPGMMEQVAVLPAAGGAGPVLEHRLADRPERLAASYTLRAAKRG